LKIQGLKKPKHLLTKGFGYENIEIYFFSLFSLFRMRKNKTPI